MAQLSNRLNRLAPSATLAMSQKSSEMKAQGIDVINMSVGEPDFNIAFSLYEAKSHTQPGTAKIAKPRLYAETSTKVSVVLTVT